MLENQARNLATRLNNERDGFEYGVQRACFGHGEWVVTVRCNGRLVAFRRG